MMQKGNILIFLLVGIIVLAAIAGAFYLGKTTLLRQDSAGQATSKPYPTPTVTSQTTPSPIQDASREPTGSAASPAPNDAGDTANWKTYTKLGYEIKYPQSSMITEYSLLVSVPNLLSSTSTEIKIDNQTSIFFLVSVWNNLGVNITDTSSRDKWCSLLQKELTGQLECNFEGKLPLVQVNGYDAYQTTGGRDSHLVKRIYIPHDKYVYELEFPIDSTGKKIIVSDQILSTFKFTQ